MTAEQLRIAVLNTVKQPRNHAPVIYRALRNDKTAEAVSSSPVAGHHKQEACCGCRKV